MPKSPITDDHGNPQKPSRSDSNAEFCWKIIFPHALRSLKDMADFEKSAADGKISSLSKRNHKLAYELIEVDWNVYFSSLSQIHYFHPKRTQQTFEYFPKVSPHPVEHCID